MDYPDTWVLGHLYAQNDKHQRQRLHSHLSSLVRLTYRRDFPPLLPYAYTDDAGWGCMLRSAQMLMAHTLLRHYMGDDWRIPEGMDARRRNAVYTQVLRWFADFPGPQHVFSIHNMVQCGMKFDKLPGEWYGPGAAALVLRDLARLHRRRYGGQLEVYVTSGDTIYISEVQALCMKKGGSDGRSCAAQRPKVDATADVAAAPGGAEGYQPLAELKSVLQSTLGAMSTPGGLPSSAAAASPPIPPPRKNDTGFFDPLLCPPPSTTVPWECALLVLVPLKLGLNGVSEAYKDEIKLSLQHRHCVGILGGRVNHAIYFVGHETIGGSASEDASDEESDVKVKPATSAASSAAVVTEARSGTMSNLVTNNFFGGRRSGRDHLLGLDPHVVHSATHWCSEPGEPFPSEDLSAQIHPSLYPATAPGAASSSSSSGIGNFRPHRPTVSGGGHIPAGSTPPAYMSLDQLDPSLALGFYFRRREEFDAFCEETRARAATNAATASRGGKPCCSLFSVQFAAPTFDFSSFDDPDGDMPDAGSGRGGSNAGGENDDDDDDEYVFI